MSFFFFFTCLWENHISKFLHVLCQSWIIAQWQSEPSKMQLQTNYRLLSSLPSPPPNPPYLSIILSQSSPTATVTPPIMCSHSCQLRVVFILYFETHIVRHFQFDRWVYDVNKKTTFCGPEDFVLYACVDGDNVLASSSMTLNKRLFTLGKLSSMCKCYLAS